MHLSEARLNIAGVLLKKVSELLLPLVHLGHSGCRHMPDGAVSGACSDTNTGRM